MTRLLRARPLALGILAVAARLAYLAAAGAPEPRNYYWHLSTSLLELGRPSLGVLSASFEPGYPAFLAVARLVTADNIVLVVGLQCLVAGLGAVLLYALTLRISGRTLAATVAAMEFACYPYLIRQSSAFTEVTVVATLLVASTVVFLGVRSERGAVACGALLSLTVLVRAALAPLAVLWAGVFWWRRQRSAAAWLAAGALVPLLPFSIMLYRHDGSLVPARDGEDLFVGNCEYSDRFIPTYDVDFLVEHAYQVAARALDVDPDEAPREVLDHEMRRQAIAFIRAHPWQTLKLKVKNIFYLFEPRIVPYVPWGTGSSVAFLPDGSFRIAGARKRDSRAELAHSLAHTFVLVTGLIGLARRRRAWREDLPLWMVLMAVTAGAAVYFPSTRIAAPVMFVWMFYSGCAFVACRPLTDSSAAARPPR